MLTQLTAHNPENITQSDTTVYDPPFKWMMVTEVNGTLRIKNERDETVNFTIPDVANGGGAPFVIPGRIRQVMSTGTSFTDANMIGYR